MALNPSRAHDFIVNSSYPMLQPSQDRTTGTFIGRESEIALSRFDNNIHSGENGFTHCRKVIQKGIFINYHVLKYGESGGIIKCRFRAVHAFDIARVHIVYSNTVKTQDKPLNEITPEEAVQECLRDLAAGRTVEETVDEHIARIVPSR